MSKRIITVRSGNEEIQMEVTEDEYRNYYRPWWQQKKREQRNREAMEERGFRTESYEEWKENYGEDLQASGSMEELWEKKVELGILEDALDSLLPEEKELAVKIFGEQVPVSVYAREKQQNRTTLSSHKGVVLEKLRQYFREHGFDI